MAIGRLSLLLFILLVTFDGAMRKWLLPGSQNLIFIAKDALLLAALLYALFWPHGSRLHLAMPQHARAALVAYGVWVLLQCFNPHLPNAAVAIWGAKNHLLYAGLIVVVAAAFRDVKSVYRQLLWIYPLLALPVCIVAMLQVYAPPDSPINQQIEANLDAISYFGEENLVRVSGTFSYLSGMGAFVQVAALIGVGLLIAGARSVPFLIAIVMVAIALPTTGSRSVIVVAAAGVLVMLAAAAAGRLISPSRAVRALAMLAVIGLASMSVMDTAWDALGERYVENQEEGKSRMITAFTNAFGFIDIAGAAGFGTGATNLGSTALTPELPPFSWLPRGITFEEESGRTVLELGWIGLILSLLFRLSLVWWSVRLLLSGRATTSRMAAVMALPFMLLGLHQGQGFTAATYIPVAYWFSVALLALAQFEENRMRVSRPQQRSRAVLGLARQPS
jgi:hypothetical protein